MESLKTSQKFSNNCKSFIEDSISKKNERKNFQLVEMFKQVLRFVKEKKS